MTSIPCPVIVAHADDAVRDDLVRALNHATEIAAVCTTCAELTQAHASIEACMLVTGVAFPDGNGIDLLLRINRAGPIPAVIATDQESLSLVELASHDTVMAYLVLPVTRASLYASMTLAYERHQQILTLQEEVRDLKKALEDRKVIERAKGVLMARERIDEREAFIRIRTRAQDARCRMVDVARELLETEPFA